MPRDMGPYYKGQIAPENRMPPLNNWGDITPAWSKAYMATTPEPGWNRGFPVTASGTPPGMVFDMDTGTMRSQSAEEKKLFALPVNAALRNGQPLGSGQPTKPRGQASHQASSGGTNFLLSALQGLQGTPNLQTPNLLTPYTFSQYS